MDDVRRLCQEQAGRGRTAPALTSQSKTAFPQEGAPDEGFVEEVHEEVEPSRPSLPDARPSTSGRPRGARSAAKTKRGVASTTGPCGIAGPSRPTPATPSRKRRRGSKELSAEELTVSAILAGEVGSVKRALGYEAQRVQHVVSKVDACTASEREEHLKRLRAAHRLQSELHQLSWEDAQTLLLLVLAEPGVRMGPEFSLQLVRHRCRSACRSLDATAFFEAFWPLPP
ncbi:MAG: DUF5102 domain-containing protein, partial [bacterium]|nr:DUF5102 domain-containing protein [bacterium]